MCKCALWNLGDIIPEFNKSRDPSPDLAFGQQYSFPLIFAISWTLIALKFPKCPWNCVESRSCNAFIWAATKLKSLQVSANVNQYWGKGIYMHVQIFIFLVQNKEYPNKQSKIHVPKFWPGHVQVLCSRGSEPLLVFWSGWHFFS